ncbi:hypothetical protein MW7_007405 [Imbroritus primus]|uniref:Uncharacterized protein n=1 Tax=Imbroritus primus TaxID=3058603 RepID=A0ACD3SQK6_9BURK|nr:hypothetical protein MW7_007405 [Burkholderiaceae bacterium PBA]
MNWLLGWKGYAAVAIAAGLFAGWAAWQWQANAYERQIARINEKQARADLSAAQQEISGLRQDTANINQKATELLGIQSTLGGQIAAIRKDMKNAKPLPADCRPDDFRVRKLSDAVAAAKQAAATR